MIGIYDCERRIRQTLRSTWEGFDNRKPRPVTTSHTLNNGTGGFES